eukprot:Gb_04431 [translate_table: standard]
MDRRNWPWRKKSSEKIASAVDQGDTSLAQPSKACEEQDVNRNVPVNLDKIVSPLQLEDKVKNLNEKLSAALAESNAKDALVRQHAKVAEEAVSGWEKAGAEAVSLKQELDVALQLKVAAEDRVSHLDGALKECMRQLRHMREEQEQSIHDAVMKKTRELDRIRIELEEKLAETNQRLLEAVAENSAIHKSLRERITSLNELSESKSHAEAQVNLLQVRLESLEDENAAVKYELRVLDKELEIRNEEREYNRRSADASNKQHLESMKKIAKLETECQRLRVLVRKRLPGPAAVAQMKMEVETLGRETAEWKKKRLHAGKGLILAGSTMGDSLHDNSRENGIKQINALSERLLAMEEENEILKETLTKRISELQASRVMCARTAGKLSQVESHLDALCRGQGLGRIGSMAIDGHVEMSKGVRMSYEPSLASISVDGGNEDEVSCAESWASALISELAQFKKVKPGIPTNKVLESTELDLMDDFVEMERLATVSSEEAAVSTLPTEIEEKTNEPRELKTEKNSNAFPMMEESADNHTSIEQHLSSFQSRTLADKVTLASFQDLFHTIMEAHAKGQNMVEVLEKVKAAITKSQYSGAEQVSKIKERLTSLKCLSTERPNNGSLEGVISETFSPQSPSEGNSSEEEMGPFSNSKESKDASCGSKLNASINKILGLIEGFVQSNSVDHDHSQTMPQNASGSLLFGNPTAVPGYTVRVLQWQNSEFNAIIQSLVKVCNDLLQGRAEMVEFAEEVGSALDWLVNHFFSLQDVSSMRATIKKRLEWDDESHSGSESEARGANSPTFGLGKANNFDKGKYENESLISTLATVCPESNNSAANVLDQLEGAQKLLSEKEVVECQLNKQISGLKDELKCVRSDKEELQNVFQLANKNIEALKAQLLESEQTIVNLQRELAATKESKNSMEDHIEHHMSMNEKLDYQLRATRTELSQAQEKLNSLQAELEEKGSCCQELEATCLDLQLQLESGGKHGTCKDEKAAVLCCSTDEDAIRLKKEREISAATEKLAECQQTILVLGKQIKALASPSDAKDDSLPSSSDPPLLEKIIPSTNQHASLFDRMQAEKGTKESQDCLTESPKTKEVLWPRTDKEKSSQQELTVPRKCKSGLLYGWQIPTDSPNMNCQDHVESQTNADNSHTDMTVTSPARSPAKFFSIKNKRSGNDASKSANAGAAGTISPKKRSHGGGFSRFLTRTRKGH